MPNSNSSHDSTILPAASVDDLIAINPLIPKVPPPLDWLRMFGQSDSLLRCDELGHRIEEEFWNQCERRSAQNVTSRAPPAALSLRGPRTRWLFAAVGSAVLFLLGAELTLTFRDALPLVPVSFGNAGRANARTLEMVQSALTLG